MPKRQPILRIVADRSGVCEVSVAAMSRQYGRAERLSAAIAPAIAIINDAISAICEHRSTSTPEVIE